MKFARVSGKMSILILFLMNLMLICYGLPYAEAVSIDRSTVPYTYVMSVGEIYPFEAAEPRHKRSDWPSSWDVSVVTEYTWTLSEKGGKSRKLSGQKICSYEASTPGDFTLTCNTLCKVWLSTTKSPDGDQFPTYASYHILVGTPRTINLNLNDGSGNTSAVTVIEEGTFNVLTTPNRAGYTFDGWYTATVGGTKIENTDSVSQVTSTTLFAHWTENRYTIRYHANGGTGFMNDQTVSYNANISLSPNAFTKTHGRLLQWNTKPDGTGTAYADRAPISRLSSKNDAVVDLYAIWVSDGNIAGCSFTLSASTSTYDGTEKKPNVTVVDGLSKLSEGINYSLSYADNVNAGVASITVTGQGQYSGMETLHFTVEKAPLPTEKIPNVSLVPDKTVTLDMSTYEKCSYESADPEIASVDSSGVIKGKKPGSTSVTVTIAESRNYFGGELSIKVDVNVFLWTLEGGHLTVQDCAPYLYQYIDSKVEDYPWYSRRNEITSVTVVGATGEVHGDMFKEYSNLRTVVLEPGVKKIHGGVFQGCSNLSNVTLPYGLEEIGTSAFEGCSFQEIDIPDSVRQFGWSTFDACKSLESIEIPYGVETIPTWMFNDCVVLRQVALPASVTKIGTSAFSNCGSLEVLELPDSLEQIGDGAFWACKSLRQLRIPDGVTEIGDALFGVCDALETVILPASLREFSLNIFDIRSFYDVPSWTIYAAKGITHIQWEQKTAYNLPNLNILFEGSETEWNAISGVDNVPKSKIIVTFNNSFPHTATYTVSYLSNGGTGAMRQGTVRSGVTFLLPECTFMPPTGKEFSSWSIDGKEYAPGTAIIVSSNVNVSAVWKDKVVQYTVTYLPNGGAGTMPQGFVAENVPFTLPECIFTPPNDKIFKAWSIDGTEYKVGETCILSDNTLVVAVWKEKAARTFPLLFLPNGGTATEIKRMVVTEGVPVLLPECPYTPPTGQQFKAWRIGTEEYNAGEYHTFYASSTSTVAFSASAVWEDDSEENGSNETNYTISVVKGPEDENHASITKSNLPNVDTIFFDLDVENLQETISANIAFVFFTAQNKFIGCTLESHMFTGNGTSSIFTDISVYGEKRKDIVTIKLMILDNNLRPLDAGETYTLREYKYFS